MPELAEIKIMSDFINEVCQEKSFTSMSFSESAWARKLGFTTQSDLQIFSISAESRGKELMLTLTQGGSPYMRISFAMGMSGHWFFGTPGAQLPKHTHLRFSSTGLDSLCLVDVRRFARWKEVDSWSQNRGPCPVKEFDQFKQNIHLNLSKKEFSKPIHLVLMNQKYFNGIGNYLRAEILFRAMQDPFEDARSAIQSNPILLELCSQLPKEAYVLGGGQLKDWENPFAVPEGGFAEWIQCYGKAEHILDKSGRTLWYHKSQLRYS